MEEEEGEDRRKAAIRLHTAGRQGDGQGQQREARSSEGMCNSLYSVQVDKRRGTWKQGKQ